ncbi:MAG: serine/threonine-protein phosphatase, partial [Leptospiraceae bacterium]|nr:serine/threonine-protein phosphatase [Leptospiraceae bacterium]
FTIALMVYFNIIPYQNIINHGVSTNLNLFSLLLSTFLLFLGCYTVNRVIFTIYSQLQEKNESLQLTLNEITNLKYQQDGDYFLTSLLIEPFNVNNTKSNKVKIEIKVNQYKKFKFKTNESEIGGDICTAENLKIGNKNFIVFLNGDAMGKSMQGAGGALVFSSVFKSILSRFEKMDPIDFSPENFIETSFYELQSIFESFEGLMMVSAILGIIDEDTGELYFLNAEHPFAILFRDNMGTFLEERTVVRKLGTPTFMQKFTNPSKFKMLKGDSIFIGSDGKDDIALLSKNERIIDSDEKRFIRVLERAGGDMDKIVEELKKEGEFADDLTLIKIHYSG